MPHRPSRLQALVRAISRDDEEAVEAALRQMARSHRALAPLAFLLGALMMLLQGLRLLIGNWRLLLLEVLPAMWIWLGMLDLKAHMFRGQQFRDWRGVSAVVLMLGIVLLTIASYYLNLVFALAVASAGAPELRPALRRARDHLAKSLLLGLVVGAALAVSAIVVPRWGLGWFALAFSVVLAVMMVTHVAFPARVLGVTSTAPRRDKMAAAAVSAAVGAAICTPAYMAGRFGVELLGSHELFVLGVVLVTVGFALQAGANGAVKAVKMSVKLVVTREAAPAARAGSARAGPAQAG